MPNISGFVFNPFGFTVLHFLIERDSAFNRYIFSNNAWSEKGPACKIDMEKFDNACPVELKRCSTAVSFLLLMSDLCRQVDACSQITTGFANISRAA